MDNGSSVVNGSSLLPTSDKVAGPGIASRSSKFNFFLHCEHIASKKKERTICISNRYICTKMRLIIMSYL